jgi:hypothetical protein
MEWLTNNGEVYHRQCTGWTTSAEAGECERCGTPIPEATRRLAQDQAAERARVAHNRDVQKSLKSITRRFAETGARADATLARASTTKKD